MKNMTHTQLIKTPLSIEEAKSTYYPMWRHHHSDKVEVAYQHPMTGTPEAVKEQFMQWALGWMDKVHDDNGIANYDNLKALWRSGEGFNSFEENAYTYSYAQAWSLLTARQKAELYLGENEKVEEIAEESMNVKNRIQRVALAEEDKGVPVSVCDYCEETYPESWILDGICPYCGHAHTKCVAKNAKEKRK